MFSKLASYASSVVNFDFLNLMPLGCVYKNNFHTKLVTYTLIPAVACGVMLAAYYLMKSTDRVHASNNVYSWLLLITFLILPSVSTTIFTTFACRTFDGDYGSYLKADYGIDAMEASTLLAVALAA